MGDQVAGNQEAFGKVVENDDGKVFSCNYCDKQFRCPQALGGHQNAHRKERAVLKRAQPVLPYDPYDPYSIPPVPMPMPMPMPMPTPHPFMDTSHYRHPETHRGTLLPRYNGNAYDLRTQFLQRSIQAPTHHYPPRYHPYGFSPNHYFGSNRPVPSRVNTSPRLFGNSLHGTPMNQSTGPAHYFPKGLNIGRDERQMWCQNTSSRYEHGSSSREKLDEKKLTDVNGREDEEGKLDLSLHL